jgi:hypothetical protein
VALADMVAFREVDALQKARVRTVYLKGWGLRRRFGREVPLLVKILVMFLCVIGRGRYRWWAKSKSQGLP